MLIYGTPDMGMKLHKRQNPLKGNKRHYSSDRDFRDQASGQKNGEDGSEQKSSSWKDKLKVYYQNPLLNFWDGIMLAVIVYSCFSSMYFAAIEFNVCNDLLFHVENVCTAFFTIDILLRFIRLPENKYPYQVTHMQIAKKYLASGSFFTDVVATIPLYLITRGQCVDGKSPDEDSSSQGTVILKLLRLVRIKRVFTIFDMGRVNKIVESLFSNQTRSKKVVFSLIMKNIYSVFRLILLTVIITYFIGCFFYLVSGLFKDEDPNFISYYKLKETPGYY